jgi:hypothetical protein
MKKTPVGFIMAGFALGVFYSGLWSQEKADPSLLTLERIFVSREFVPERFGPARWMRGRSSFRRRG